MTEINKLLEAAGRALTPRSDASQTEAGPTDGPGARGRRQHGRAHSGQQHDGTREQREKYEASGGNGPDLIDAINQIFAEFELAYHNQYYKAYRDADHLIMVKKYWLECLRDFKPQHLVAAARRLVKSQEYLPTISAVIRACESGHDLFGLPSVRDAYVEACRAPAPKRAYAWSHPAVYHAGKSADWFQLATEPEDKVFPLFSYYYRQLCDRVMHGETLDEPVPPALPEKLSRPLSYEEREEQLQGLRAKLDI